MVDCEKERTARNKDVIARMCVTPTKAQILSELDLEISDAINFAVAMDLQALVSLLRMAKSDVSRLRQRPEYKT